MRRPLPLRQIEIFKALIENGTVSRAAEMLFISQPAASKLLVQLEEDNGLKLFDRHKGRLTPTAQALRLYEEVSKIFAGVHNLEGAIELIKREDQSQLVVGVIPGLAGAVIQRATMNFLSRNPDVYCSFHSVGSHWIADRVLRRIFDIGVGLAGIENPYLVTKPVLEYPLICIMPVGHPLSAQKVIVPEHLNSARFVAFKADSYTGQRVGRILERHDIKPEIVLTADASITVCEFVAAGLGVSVVHPLFVLGMEDRIVIRPFEPKTRMAFHVFFPRDARNAVMVANFIDEMTAMAAVFHREFVDS